MSDSRDKAEKEARHFVLVDRADSSKRQEIMVGSLVMLEDYYVGCDPIFCVRPLHCKKPMQREGYKHPGIVLKIFNETGPDGVDKNVCWIAPTGTFKKMPLDAWAEIYPRKLHRSWLSLPIKHAPTLHRLPFIHLTYGQMYEQSYARAECILAIPMSRLRPFRPELSQHPVRIDRKGYGDLIRALDYPKGLLVFGTYDDHCKICVTSNERFARYPHNPLLAEHTKRIHEDRQVALDMQETERKFQEGNVAFRTQHVEVSREAGERLVENSEISPKSKPLADLAEKPRVKPTRTILTLPKADIEVPQWSSLPIYDTDFNYLKPKTRRERRLEKKVSRRQLKTATSRDDLSSDSDSGIRRPLVKPKRSSLQFYVSSIEPQDSAVETGDTTKDREPAEPLIEDKKLEQVSVIADTEIKSANPPEAHVISKSLADQYLAAFDVMDKKLDILHDIESDDPRAPYALMEVRAAMERILEIGDDTDVSWGGRDTKTAQKVRRSSSPKQKVKPTGRVMSTPVLKPKAEPTTPPKKIISPVTTSRSWSTRNARPRPGLNIRTRITRIAEPAQPQLLPDGPTTKLSASLHIGIAAVVLLVSAFILLYQNFLRPTSEIIREVNLDNVWRKGR